MRTHSENDDNIYLGTGLVNGIFCHRWIDGTTLPVLRGAADDDDEGDDDESGSGDDEKDDEDDDKTGDDDDSDDDDKDERKPSEKSTNRAHRDAAKYRVQRNAYRAKLADAETALEAERAAHAKTKTEGAGDEALKAEIVTLKTELDEVKSKLSDREKADVARTAAASVEEALDDLDIEYDDLDWVIIKLQKSGMYDVDEDGDVEDLTANLKKLLKKGTLKKKSASGDDDDEDSSSGGSGPSRSGRKVHPRQKGKTSGYDAAKLAKKYPALRR